MTRTPLSKSKGQRSRSPGRFTHRRVGASGGCSGGRENVLAVENCCYVAVYSAAEGASAPTGGGDGRGHTVAAAPLQLVYFASVQHPKHRCRPINSRPAIDYDHSTTTPSKITCEFNNNGNTVELQSNGSRIVEEEECLFASDAVVTIA